MLAELVQLFSSLRDQLFDDIGNSSAEALVYYIDLQLLSCIFQLIARQEAQEVYIYGSTKKYMLPEAQESYFLIGRSVKFH